MAVLPAKVKKISRENKTVELEDGRIIPLPEDLAQDLFQSEHAKQKQQRTKESYVAQATGFPLGEEAGAVLSGAGKASALAGIGTKYIGDLVTQGIASIGKGKGQENKSFYERLSENVGAVRKGREEAQQQIQQRNPKSFLGGQVAGMAVDIAAPLGRVLKGGPMAQGAAMGGIMGLGAGNQDIVTNPMGAGKELLAETALGAGLGAGIGKLSKIAQERAAIRKYPEILKAHQEATTKAEKDFLVKMAKGIDTIQSDLKGKGIAKTSLGIDDFINQNIGTSAIAGTPEAKQLTNFLESLSVSAPEHMNAMDVRNIFQAIEGRLAKATPIEGPILNSFRDHLVQRIPVGAANSATRAKYGTRLIDSLDKHIDSAVNSFLSDKQLVGFLKKYIGGQSLQGLGDDLKRFVRSGFDKLSPQEFIQDLQSGNFADRIMWYLDNNKKLMELTGSVNHTVDYLKKLSMAQMRHTIPYEPETLKHLLKAKDRLANMRTEIADKFSKDLNKNSRGINSYHDYVLNNVSDKLSDAVGIQNPLAGANPPSNIRPMPTPAPLPPQTGRMAGYFETPNFYRSQLSKLAGLGKGSAGKLAKFAWIGAGLPKAGAAAATVGTIGGLTAALRGVTSPTALGSIAREGIKRGGIRFIVESIAQKYPSYQNGVLQDPQERRAASSEIEQDQDIGIEDKAMLQTSINRGKNLENLIKGESNGPAYA